jgi:hypothetical protein
MHLPDRTEIVRARQGAGIRPVFAYWMASVLLFAFFCLGDASVVAWSANLVSAGELAAVWVAFILITFGIMVTVLLVPAVPVPARPAVSGRDGDRSRSSFFSVP